MKTPEQQSELKACPFCEAVPELIHTGKMSTELNTRYWIECENDACAISPNTGYALSAIEVINRWNTRPTSAADLLAKAREWCKGETTHVTYEGEYQMKNSEKSAAWLLAFLEAEVGK